MNDRDHAWSRRDFVRGTASCAAHLGLMAAAPWLPRRLWAQERHPVVAREPWGRIEEVARGVWALVSTPLDGDRTTLCNGGIVAGRSGVLVVEAFGSDAGATWMAQQAKTLTGRAPTHVVLTHYHGDHTGGLRGALTEDVALLSTDVTRRLVEDRNQDPPRALLDGAELLDPRRPSEIDLGGRSVLVVPRNGHTDSDVSLEISDPSVVFCGDLVWNRMFPNYMDAIPSRLSANVKLLRTLGAATYVPGHGPLADATELDRYQSLLDDVEAAARRAVERGMSAEDAGAAYRIPTALGEWTLFSPSYFGRAIGAWMKELGA
jgi:glyoxylase-like metal-dependent hydrolase (beta-lactamase superfamily II)